MPFVIPHFNLSLYLQDPFLWGRDANRLLYDREDAETMEATTISRAPGRAPGFAITPAHPFTNAQGKGRSHTHGEKPQGREGSSRDTRKPPVSPDLPLCST